MSEHAEHQAGAAEHGGGEHAPSPAQLLWPTFNFVLFVAVLVRFLRGPIRENFRARGARLKESLEAGARARTAAETLRAELNRAMADLPSLRERLKADLRATAERERDNLIEQGRRAADRIRGDAKVLAEQEFAAARNAVRAEVSGEAIRQATELIGRALGPEDQERFVRDFVSSAGTSA
jgi:F-type H+-transporting ATPase subunit b